MAGKCYDDDMAEMRERKKGGSGKNVIISWQSRERKSGKNQGFVCGNQIDTQKYDVPGECISTPKEKGQGTREEGNPQI